MTRHKKGKKTPKKKLARTTTGRSKREWTQKKLTKITIILALIALIAGFIYFVLPQIPAPKLHINILTGINASISYDENYTSITGIDMLIPTMILNTGNTPIHVMACDVFLNYDGKPANLTQQEVGAILDLKPTDSCKYNFTKHFDVSMCAIPVANLTIQDVYKFSEGYFLYVEYYTEDIRNSQSYWLDITEYLKHYK